MTTEKNYNEYGYGRIAYEKALNNEKKIAMSEKSREISDINELTATETFKYFAGPTIKKFCFTSNSEVDEFTVKIDSSESLGAKATLNGRQIYLKEAADDNEFSFKATCKSGLNKLIVVFTGASAQFAVSVSVRGRVEQIEENAVVDYAANGYFSVLKDGKFTLYGYLSSVFTEKVDFYGVESGDAMYHYFDSVFYIAIRYVTGKTVIYYYDPTYKKTSVFSEDFVFKDAAFCFSNGLYFYYTVAGRAKCAKLTLKKTEKLSFTFKADFIHSSYNYRGTYIYIRNAYGYYVAYEVGDDGELKTSTKISLGKALFPKIRYDNKNETTVLFGSGENAESVKSYTAKIEDGRAGVGKFASDYFPIAESGNVIMAAPNGAPIKIEQL